MVNRKNIGGHNLLIKQTPKIHNDFRQEDVKFFAECGQHHLNYVQL